MQNYTKQKLNVPCTFWIYYSCNSSTVCVTKVKLLKFSESHTDVSPAIHNFRVFAHLCLFCATNILHLFIQDIH